MKNIYSFFAIILFLGVSLTVCFHTAKWRRCEQLNWDISGYHLYLPAIFIYHDLGELKFYKTIDTVYRPTGTTKNYALYRNQQTGRALDKYPCGVAIFELPFYAVAHVYCLVTHQYPLDGYSSPFQLAVALSTILFTVIAFFLLRLFLLRYTNDWSTAITILILGFGTNIYHYASVDQGLSHLYLFFLYASVLVLTDSWYKEASLKRASLLGLAIGMAVITRPTDVLIILIPLLWRINNPKWLLEHLRIHLSKIIVAFFIFCIPILFQLSYWKYITGHWLYFSYEEEHFTFLHPHIIEGLFSYRKGWFVYTPLALLGFAGLIYMGLKRKFTSYLIPVCMYFVFSFYIIFSWALWYYGGGFGCRVMIQSLALLALPIAFLIEGIFLSKNRIAKPILALLIISGIGLNLFQSIQYYKGVIHWDAMNKAYYWRVFGKTSINDDDRKLLHSTP